MRAMDMGKRVALVEKDKVGGTGIYNGALASKTLWELSQRVASANETIRTRGREPFRVTWDEVARTLDEAVFERKYLYACHMQLLGSPANGGERLRHLRGEALSRAASSQYHAGRAHHVHHCGPFHHRDRKQAAWIAHGTGGREADLFQRRNIPVEGFP
jgi:hypothetical protein